MAARPLIVRKDAARPGETRAVRVGPRRADALSPTPRRGRFEPARPVVRLRRQGESTLAEPVIVRWSDAVRVVPDRADPAGGTRPAAASQRYVGTTGRPRRLSGYAMDLDPPIGGLRPAGRGDVGAGRAIPVQTRTIPIGSR
ncbi:hypothetical protein GCM10012279_52540 [Micromonospora yangpuensis]|uniref:Uncharacterized protein n=1 Tax=Micromonospora yangpuensis TaxID=683228 RepID=A0A1C6UDY4_9ACTN|nr:hypothetical protein GCM10012279_52540 [Micromonospora yangpuensis]SCL52305.1 hypothetical protein GA0070617_2032 [Micromonospora yangpuensis]